MVAWKVSSTTCIGREMAVSSHLGHQQLKTCAQGQQLSNAALLHLERTSGDWAWKGGERSGAGAMWVSSPMIGQ